MGERSIMLLGAVRQCGHRSFTRHATSAPKLAVIGAGVMAEAIVGGVVAGGKIEAKNISCYDISTARTKEFTETFDTRAAADLQDCCIGADTILLAVKPQNMPAVCEGLTGVVDPSQVVITMAAGVPIQQLQKGIPSLKHVVRIMPNTPAKIRQGITVWCSTDNMEEGAQKQVRDLLRCIGEEVYVEDENFLDMATAISGSGPAYIFLMLESMIEAGVHMGFPRGTAQKLVEHTMKGSIDYALARDKTSVHTLRNEITSPGGTTASALYRLEKGNFRTVVSDGVWSAYRRSLELGNQESNVGPGRSQTRQLPVFWQDDSKQDLRDDSY